MLLSISFGTHHLKMPGGRFWFGVSGGELELKPTAGAFLPEHFWPDNPLPASVAVKRTVRVEQRDKHHRTLGAKGAAGATPTGEASASSEREAEHTHSAEDAFEQVQWPIVVQGSPAHPLWKFETPLGQPCLKGRLTRQEIARLGTANHSAALTGRFSVFKSDIRPLRAEGLWPSDISPVKHAVLSALLRDRVFKRLGAVVGDAVLPPAPATEAARTLEPGDMVLQGIGASAATMVASHG